MIEVNKMADCNLIKMTVPTIKESLPTFPKQILNSYFPQDNKFDLSELLYIGMLKKAEMLQPEPIACIEGAIHRAQVEPYRFGKSKFDFELHYIITAKNKASKEQIKNSSMLLTIIPKDDAITSIYSTSGHGFTIYKNTVVQICGQLLIVDIKDGSLISRLEGKHVIEHLFGKLKIYVCDENIILLDNKTHCFQIDNNKPK